MNANTSPYKVDTSDAAYRTPWRIQIFILLLGILFLSAGTVVRAQTVQFAPMGPGVELSPATSAYINVEDLSRPVLLRQTKSWWKEVRKEHTRVLKSSDRDAQAKALQNIIFFRTYCPENADFDRSAMTVYRVFRNSDDKQIRIMALGALSAIGNADAMAYLGQSVRLESDPHIRRLTLAALRDFYGADK
jgi:hypothetical protein